MSSIDAYSNCPCGSGEKYKFCCQKAEAYNERAARLMHAGSTEAAFKVIEEGLRAFPTNPWLGMRRVVLLLERDGPAAAISAANGLAGLHPGHPAVRALLVRLMSGVERPGVVMGQLQAALEAVPAEKRKLLGQAAMQVASSLFSANAVPAAVAIMEAFARIDAEESATISNSLSALYGDSKASVWVRNPYELSPVPDGLDEARGTRFASALKAAEAGLFSAAAREFDGLSKLGTPESDRNLGLCRLWLADHAGAVDALRRYTSWIGPTLDTLALEALCQEIEPLRHDEMVEQLQWIWPLRDRAALLASLESNTRVVSLGRRPINPADEESPEVDMFVLLDRPIVSGDQVVDAGSLSAVMGYLLVGEEIAAIEAYDDGRLDRASEWFRSMAGSAIPPAHPRTKPIHRHPRHLLATRLEWALPEGAKPEDLKHVLEEAREAHLLKVWPDTPLPALAGRTPRQSVGEKDLELPLRAALAGLEVAEQSRVVREKLGTALRAALGVAPEPPIDPATVDVDSLHIAWLSRLDPAQLDDERLLRLLAQARLFRLVEVMEACCHEVIRRPGFLESNPGVSTFEVYGSLAQIALADGDGPRALECIEEGRKSKAGVSSVTEAAQWDMLEVRLRAGFEAPETWVPVLAANLDRYRQTEAVGEIVLQALMSMGLMQPVRDPDQPDQVYLDARVLESLLSRYGPRITTAGGELGVSAARNEIWTPETDAGTQGSGGLWIPGSGASEAGPTQSKIIVPGR